MMTIFQDIAASCSEKEFSLHIPSSSGGHKNDGHENDKDNTNNNDHAQFDQSALSSQGLHLHL